MKNHVHCKAFKLENYDIYDINTILKQFDNVVNAQLIQTTHELIVFYKEKQNLLTEN